jgi:hypothetical protein
MMLLVFSSDVCAACVREYNIKRQSLIEADDARWLGWVAAKCDDVQVAAFHLL